MVLARHCGEARSVWNQALAAVKAEEPFFEPTRARAGDLVAGGRSSSVRQQALGDLGRALANAKKAAHRFPIWRTRGGHEGFWVRVVTVKVLSCHVAELTVRKAGRVRLRLSRPLPEGHGIGRVTRDVAGVVARQLRWPPAGHRTRTRARAGLNRAILVKGRGLCVLAPTLGQGECRHRPVAGISPSRVDSGNPREGAAP